MNIEVNLGVTAGAASEKADQTSFYGEWEDEACVKVELDGIVTDVKLPYDLAQLWKEVYGCESGFYTEGKTGKWMPDGRGIIRTAHGCEPGRAYRKEGAVVEEHDVDDVCSLLVRAAFKYSMYARAAETFALEDNERCAQARNRCFDRLARIWKKYGVDCEELPRGEVAKNFYWLQFFVHPSRHVVGPKRVYPDTAVVCGAVENNAPVAWSLYAESMRAHGVHEVKPGARLVSMIAAAKSRNIYVNYWLGNSDGRHIYRVHCWGMILPSERRMQSDLTRTPCEIAAPCNRPVNLKGIISPKLKDGCLEVAPWLHVYKWRGGLRYNIIGKCCSWTYVNGRFHAVNLCRALHKVGDPALANEFWRVVACVNASVACVGRIEHDTTTAMSYYAHVRPNAQVWSIGKLYRTFIYNWFTVDRKPAQNPTFFELGREVAMSLYEIADILRAAMLESRCVNSKCFCWVDRGYHHPDITRRDCDEECNSHLFYLFEIACARLRLTDESCSLLKEDDQFFLEAIPFDPPDAYHPKWDALQFWAKRVVEKGYKPYVSGNSSSKFFVVDRRIHNGQIVVIPQPPLESNVKSFSIFRNIFDDIKVDWSLFSKQGKSRKVHNRKERAKQRRAEAEVLKEHVVHVFNWGDLLDDEPKPPSSDDLHIEELDAEEKPTGRYLLRDFKRQGLNDAETTAPSAVSDGSLLSLSESEVSKTAAEYVPENSRLRFEAIVQDMKNNLQSSEVKLLNLEELTNTLNSSDDGEAEEEEEDQGPKRCDLGFTDLEAWEWLHDCSMIVPFDNNVSWRPYYKKACDEIGILFCEGCYATLFDAFYCYYSREHPAGYRDGALAQFTSTFSQGQGQLTNGLCSWCADIGSDLMLNFNRHTRCWDACVANLNRVVFQTDGYFVAEYESQEPVSVVPDTIAKLDAVWSSRAKEMYAMMQPAEPVAKSYRWPDVLNPMYYWRVLTLGFTLLRVQAFYSRFSVDCNITYNYDHIVWLWRLFCVFVFSFMPGSHTCKCDPVNRKAFDSQLANLLKDYDGEDILIDDHKYDNGVVRICVRSDWAGRIKPEVVSYLQNLDQIKWVVSPVLPRTGVNATNSIVGCDRCAHFDREATMYVYKRTGDSLQNVTGHVLSIFMYLVTGFELLFMLLKRKLDSGVQVMDTNALKFALAGKHHKMKIIVKSLSMTFFKALSDLVGVRAVKYFFMLSEFSSNKETETTINQLTAHMFINAFITFLAGLLRCETVSFVTTVDMGTEWQAPRDRMVNVFDKKTKVCYTIDWHKVQNDSQLFEDFRANKIYWQLIDNTTLVKQWKPEGGKCEHDACVRKVTTCFLCDPTQNPTLPKCLNCLRYYVIRDVQTVDLDDPVSCASLFGDVAPLKEELTDYLTHRRLHGDVFGEPLSSFKKPAKHVSTILDWSKKLKPIHEAFARQGALNPARVAEFKPEYEYFKQRYKPYGLYDEGPAEEERDDVQEFLKRFDNFMRRQERRAEQTEQEKTSKGRGGRKKAKKAMEYVGNNIMREIAATKSFVNKVGGHQESGARKRDAFIDEQTDMLLRDMNVGEEAAREDSKTTFNSFTAAIACGTAEAALKFLAEDYADIAYRQAGDENKVSISALYAFADKPRFHVSNVIKEIRNLEDSREQMIYSTYLAAMFPENIDACNFKALLDSYPGKLRHVANGLESEAALYQKAQDERLRRSMGTRAEIMRDKANVMEQESRRILTEFGGLTVPAIQVVEPLPADAHAIPLEKQGVIVDVVLCGRQFPLVHMGFCIWNKGFMYVNKHFFVEQGMPQDPVAALKKVSWLYAAKPVTLEFGDVQVADPGCELFRVAVRVFDGGRELTTPAIPFVSGKDLDICRKTATSVTLDYRPDGTQMDRSHIPVTAICVDSVMIEDCAYSSVWKTQATNGQAVCGEGVCGLPYFRQVDGQLKSRQVLFGAHVAGCDKSNNGALQELGGRTWQSLPRKMVLQGNVNPNLLPGPNKLRKASVGSQYQTTQVSLKTATSVGSKRGTLRAVGQKPLSRKSTK